MAAKSTATPKDRKSARKKILFHVGGPYHQTRRVAEAIAGNLEENGDRYRLRITENLDDLAELDGYDALAVYSMGVETLPGHLEKSVVDFVAAGGALIGLHCAACQFPKSEAWGRLLGGQFDHHPPPQRFPVAIQDPSRPATRRVLPFEIFDELYLMKNLAGDIDVLATTRWKDRDVPLIWTRSQGKGRVYFNALGHGPEQIADPVLAKSIRRGFDWACGIEEPARPIRCAMLGYGGAFSMGRRHSEDINAVTGMTAVAACDIDPDRAAQAQEDFPAFDTYTDPDDLLADDEIDLVVIILPHNLHAEYAIRCLQAGKHVVLEKPFCLTLDEADAMLAAADQAGKMLTCYHNRRWDGDYRTLRRIIESGRIGEVFEIQAGFARYGRPRHWWRSSKEISGGTLYDWGAHFTDWILGLIDEKIVEVSGFFQTGKVWLHQTNEDHTQAIVRFANGAMADLVISQISAAGRPRWRICGTRGAILDDGSVEKGCRVLTRGLDGQMIEQIVKWGPSRWEEYYVNLADHLLAADDLVVKPEQARRVIGVIETAEKSSKQGKALSLPGE